MLNVRLLISKWVYVPEVQMCDTCYTLSLTGQFCILRASVGGRQDLATLKLARLMDYEFGNKLEGKRLCNE